MIVFWGKGGGTLFWKTFGKKGLGVSANPNYPYQSSIMFTAPFRADNLIFVDEEIQSCTNKISPRALTESEFGLKFPHLQTVDDKFSSTDIR